MYYSLDSRKKFTLRQGIGPIYRFYLRAKFSVPLWKRTFPLDKMTCMVDVKCYVSHREHTI